MKKALSTLLAAALVLSVFTTVFTVSAFAEEPENVKVITNADDLADAIANQTANETWKLAEGTYNLTQAHLDQYKAWNEPGQGNWYFPIHEEGITIIGEDDVTVTSDVESKTTLGLRRTSSPFGQTMSPSTTSTFSPKRSRTKPSKLWPKTSPSKTAKSKESINGAAVRSISTQSTRKKISAMQPSKTSNCIRGSLQAIRMPAH